MIDKVKFKNDQWNKLNQWSNENTHLKLVNDDNYAFSIIQSLLIGQPYIPFNTFAYRPYALALILNEIIINQRKSVIEFGAGISTILVGRLIKQNKLNAKLLSIEHNEDWYNLMQQQIMNEDLGEIISLQHIPLIDNNKYYANWYDIIKLKSILHDKFDFMIVDGPPGFPEENKKARFPALPVIHNFFNENHCIILDDADREGESSILDEWSTKYNYQFDVISKNIGVAYQGRRFYSIPRTSY